MLKFLGNFGGMLSAIRVLHVVPLLLLLSATLGHAQTDCTLTEAQYIQNPTLGGPYPSIWPTGQSTTVTLAGSWTTPPLPLGCETDFINLQGAVNGSANGDCLAGDWCGTGVPDPNVTISNIGYSLAPSQTTFTATVSPTAPYAVDYYTVRCVGPCPEWVEYGGVVTICPYSVPAISSVSPSTWVAGQTYNVTISGSNFVPGTLFDGATAYPGCPQTEVYLSYPDGDTVSFSATVQSASTITADVTLSAKDKAGTATIYVWTWENGPSSTTASEQATVKLVADPCPVPTVSSISQNVWFAGQSYNDVTIKGKNFITAAKATATCPATTVSINAPSGASVALGAVTVNSSTQITIASVTPPANETNEPVTVIVSGNPTGETNNAWIENPQPSIATLQYTNSQPLWQDGPSNATPVAMSQTVWTPSSSFPSVFVSGNTINATATFNVIPTLALSGARIEGSVKGLGLLVASNVSIPAKATSITVNLTGNTAFPASQTQHYQPLGVTWSFSSGGQPCSSGPSQCEPAGSTSSEVYVTLATPLPFSEPTMTVMPLTAVKLAIGSGGATTQTTAFQNTWQNFVGPANVTGWDTRPLPYYLQGVMALANATDAYELLASEDSNGNPAQTETGQCGSFAHLLIDALAVNGIPSTFTVVQPNDNSQMLVNNWEGFNGPGSLPSTPFNWELVLPIENYVQPEPGMVPLSSVSGDLTSGTGAAGQNSPTPAEKVFGLHFIVQAAGGYYDPSYGVTYTSECDFENHLAGYAFPISQSASNVTFEVRKASGCNVTFTPRPVPTPGFSLALGTYAGAQTVTITDPWLGTSIYYTTDGTIPTSFSTLYTGPITVSGTETINAVATMMGYTNSAIVSAVYTITP
jgi:hypothetical protein